MNTSRFEDRSLRRLRLLLCAALVGTSAGLGALGLTSAASAAPLPQSLVLSPVLDAAGKKICDVLDNEPDYSDVACDASGSSAYFGADEHVLAATIVLESSPLQDGTPGPFQSTTYVVQLGVEGTHRASFGIDGKGTNDNDYLYVGCVGGALVPTPARMALDDRAITVKQVGQVWHLTFHVPRAALLACGIQPTTSLTPFMGTSQAGPLDNVNKDKFFGDKVDFTVVQPANAAPVAVNDEVTVEQDSSAAPVAVLPNDRDPDGPEEGLSVVSVGPASHGTASLVGGVVSYEPAAGFVGTDTFSYVIKDALGAVSPAATVTVTISKKVVQPPANQAPVAVDDAVTVAQDSPAAPVGVLPNDSDPDGQRADLSVVSVAPASHGTSSLAGGVVSYVPAAGFFGTDAFTYVIKDAHGATSTPATVTVTVTKAVVQPTEQPTEDTTDTPSPQPTEDTTDTPSPQPTEDPTDTPSPQPTDEPAQEPTQEPTDSPTVEPSPIEGTTSPQPAESEEPTHEPTQEPTHEPTQGPTQEPTSSPDPVEGESEQPATLPFTGSSTDMLLGAGAGLSVIGLMLALTGRRRRLVE